MPIQESTVVRRQLGRRLRRLREAAGKTERDVEEASLASRAKLWRIESGKVPTKVADVRALCWLYGADQQTTDALAELAVGTTAQGWWEDYEGNTPPRWFWLYLGLEAAATEIRTYNPEVVHGLLQVPAYVRAVHEASNPEIDENVVSQQIKLRGERQLSLTSRIPPLRLTAILGAGVLARPVGGAQVMAEQVARLRELGALDHIDVRILPWAAGAHAAMAGAFTILDFESPDDPAVVYAEMHTGGRYLERPEELAEYRRVFDLIYQKSVPIEESGP
jgi:transcriptional regulator with XRE-family HTH domain